MQFSITQPLIEVSFVPQIEGIPVYRNRLLEALTEFQERLEARLNEAGQKYQARMQIEACIASLDEYVRPVESVRNEIQAKLLEIDASTEGLLEVLCGEHLEGRSDMHSEQELIEFMSLTSLSLDDIVKFTGDRTNRRYRIMKAVLPLLGEIAQQAAIKDAIDYCSMYLKVVAGSEPGQAPASCIKTELTSGEIALLAKSMMEVGIITNDNVTEVLRAFAQCFGKQDGTPASVNSLREKFYRQSSASAKKLWEKLSDLQQYTHSIK